MFRKRGRPKTRYAKEKSISLTKLQVVPEPFDMCLQQGIINVTQHRAGLRLRWLYTLHFGLPTVQGYDLTKVRGRDPSRHDEKWLTERRNEYKTITTKLHHENKNAARILYNIVVYHYYPSFLQQIMQNEIRKKLQNLSLEKLTLNKKTSISKNVAEKELFKIGIEMLEDIYNEIRACNLSTHITNNQKFHEIKMH
jgi:hypothetical protein